MSPASHNPKPSAPQDKLAVAVNLMVYPAACVAVWLRSRTIGGRIVSRYVGLMSLVLLLATALLSPGPERTIAFIFALATTLLSLKIRFVRWRQFRRGVRQHSFYLGNSDYAKLLPPFLRIARRWERSVEPLLVAAGGFLLLRFLPHIGAWLVFSGLCLACVEQATSLRHYNERLDVVDDLVHGEAQTEAVENFSGPGPANRPDGSASLPTGLANDISSKVKRGQSAPPKS